MKTKILTARFLTQSLLKFTKAYKIMFETQFI